MTAYAYGLKIRIGEEVRTTETIPATKNYPELPKGSIGWVAYHLDPTAPYYHGCGYDVSFDEPERRIYRLPESVLEVTEPDRPCPCGKPTKHPGTVCNPHPCSICELPVYNHRSSLCEHCKRAY